MVIARFLAICVPKHFEGKGIEDYKNTSLEGYYSIDVSIFSDFSSLSNLYILQRTDNDEIKSLLNE